MLITNLVPDLAYFYQVCSIGVDHDRVCVSVNHIKTQLTEFKKKKKKGKYFIFSSSSCL